MISGRELLIGDDDALLERAVVSILDRSGNRLLGTGCFVSPSGAVLTACHVVAGLDAVVVCQRNGTRTVVEVSSSQCSAASDLAVLATGLDDCDALAIAEIESYLPKTFKTRGFQFKDRGLRDAVPLGGAIGGRTHLEYGDYRIDNALLLPNLPVDKGISGAPLLDPDTRAIIGVIVSGFPKGPHFGFATPLDGPRCKWAPLRALIEESSEATPRFGKLANLRGAHVICDIQRKAATDFLYAAGLFKRTKTIDREAAISAVGEFVVSPAAVMPVSGLSGVGKTSLLAAIADSDADSQPPRLLVRGVDIVPGQDGLKGLVDSALRSIGSGRYLTPGFDGETVSTAAQRQRVPLLILLDGLNEASITNTELVRNWIPRTLRWLEGSNIKLVLTSRTEFWAIQQSAWPSEKLYLMAREIPIAQSSQPTDKLGNPAPPEPHPRTPFVLANFSVEEATQALDAYGLANALSVSQALHPFFLALAEELGLAVTPVASNFFAVTDMYVRRKIEQALLKIGRPLWSQAVTKHIQEVAAYMLVNDTQFIDSATILKTFESHVEVIDALAGEHVWLLETPGYRFQHDQVREYLQGLTVDAVNLLRTLDYPVLRRPSPGMPLGPREIFGHGFALMRCALRNVRLPHQPRNISASVAAFAILRAVTSDRTAFIQALELLERATQHYPRSRRSKFAQDIAVLLIVRLRSADTSNSAYVAWAKRIFENETRNIYARDDAAAQTLTNAVSELNFEVADKLDLLRLMLLTEWGSYWSISALRSEAWNTRYIDRTGSDNDPARYTLSRAKGRPIAYEIERLAAKEPEATLEGLFGWLRDRSEIGTRVSGGWKSTIADCGAICLFYLRNLRPDWFYTRLLSDTELLGKQSLAVDTLVDSLAVLETDKTLATTLSLLGSNDAHNRRLVWAAWLCMANAGDVTIKLLAFNTFSTILQSNPDGETAIWLSRALFVEYIHWEESSRGQPAEASVRAIASSLLGQMAPAAHHIFGIISNHSREPMECDYRYALVFDFDRAIAIIRERVAHSLVTRSLVKGLGNFLSPIQLKRSASLQAQYIQVVDLLRTCFLVGSQDVQHALAERLHDLLGHAGRDPHDWSFRTEDVVAIGALELGKLVLRDSTPWVRQHLKHLAMSSRGMIRTEMLDVIRSEAIDEETYEAFVYELISNVRHYNGSLDELASFRIATRAAVWDQAALRSIRASLRDYGTVSERLVEFWRALPDASKSVLVQEFFFHLEHAKSTQEAALRTLMHPEGKRMLLRQLGLKFDGGSKQ